jgi:putative polyhydroxyalkanoate system protein
MSTIDIRRKHALSLPAAKKQTDLMAEHLAEEFSLESTWRGDELHFSRSGVQGVMKVTKDQVHVTAKLGLLVTLLKGQIEKRLHAHFDEAFDAPASKPAAGKPAAKKTVAKAPAAKKATAKTATPKTTAAKKTPAKTTAAKKAAARR